VFDITKGELTAGWRNIEELYTFIHFATVVKAI
jgi:hypothetical protein